MYDTLDEVLGEKIPHLRKKSVKYTGEKFDNYGWQKIRGILLCGGSLVIWPAYPTYTLYTCIQVLYTSSHREREGGEGEEIEPERRLEGQRFTKLGRKKQHDWLSLQPINSDKHLPQSPCTGQFFRWRQFAFSSMRSYLPIKESFFKETNLRTHSIIVNLPQRG